MKKLMITALLSAASALGSTPQGRSRAPTAEQPAYVAYWQQIRTAIESHLNRPYVWGACGMKSFDCSGFVWRVMFESGVMVKRTTARKYYMAMPAVRREHRYASGTLVFFDDLKHCGIVADENSFYHSQSSIGTNLSKFDPYWRPKVYGFRAFPGF